VCIGGDLVKVDYKKVRFPKRSDSSGLRSVLCEPARLKLYVYGVVPQYCGHGRPPTQPKPGKDWLYLQTMTQTRLMLQKRLIQLDDGLLTRRAFAIPCNMARPSNNWALA
jgi:hypothetical protein